MAGGQGAFPDFALLLIRSVPMAMLIGFHGWDKFLAAMAHIFQGKEWPMVGFVGSMGFPVPVFFAVCVALAESVVALLLVLGLFTRYAAAFVAINFAVATYQHVRTDMKYELAALYLLVALIFIFTSPGKFSLDAAFSRRR
jgi:putative oxidoreductase